MTLRLWPRVAAFALAAIPVAVLAFMIATIAVRALPAVTNDISCGAQSRNLCYFGLGQLFSTHFSSRFLGGVGLYGLVPSLWGSLEVVAISMTLAVPISLAMAITASEFAPGVAGRAMRTLLGLLAGIPPIIYALMAVVFVAPFMIPKFTGNLSYSHLDATKVGVANSDWPPTGVPWNAGSFAWNPSGESSSVLLGGILLALLAIPFMAPLIEDALRNVPREPKDASLALGASRWYTLLHITLPQGLAGIIAAIRLGSLKVLGDVMIALFVIGFAAVALPNPLWDVLERTAPLTSEGVGLIGGFQGTQQCNPADCAAGYFTGLLLLFAAFAIVMITLLLEWVARRTFAR